MRTTIEIPDELLLSAKRAALERRSTLKELVIEGLKLALEGSRIGASKKIFNTPVHILPEHPLPPLTHQEISLLLEEEETEHQRAIYSRR